jgi:hypothetical protein
MVAIHAMCITGAGGWAIPGSELFIFVPVLCLGATILALPCLLLRQTRRVSLEALFYSVGLLVLFMLALGIALRARQYGFELAASRARPLVEAIARFEKDHGRPPESLSDVVPKYLGQLPQGIPDVHLITGEDTREMYAGNTWVLRALVPSGVINFDQFMYFPNQDYPEYGYGGGVERIADWAYVHE